MEPPQGQVSQIETNHNANSHVLFDKWTLWAHLPHDTDWSLKSYRKIIKFNSVEEVIALVNSVPDLMIKNCMLFLMRDGINPTWEDPANVDGGCFSFKIPNKNIAKIWRDMVKVLAGETISNDTRFLTNVNGLTITPKRSFCILKIWMKSLDYNDPSKICDINELNVHGCLFKRHNPSK